MCKYKQAFKTLHLGYLKIGVLLLTMQWSVSSNAQNEAANWYFGNRAGLSFVSGAPEVLLDGEIDSLEGCATISTPEGALLFYTNGVTIWNRFHQIMDNGDDLIGSDSSTQSAIIVPDPGSSTLYYVFTTDAVQYYVENGTGAGFNYSIVDMSDGTGIVTAKNINLLPNSSEKVTALNAANGEDYWIITHYQNRFYSYALTTAGLEMTPVVSTTPYTIDSFSNIRGAMKASPKGDRVAIAHTLFEPNYNGRLYLYDFDNASGQLSNELLLNEGLVYYGVEFSSDGSRLYASSKTLTTDQNGNIDTEDFVIEQFDLEAAPIANSRLTLTQFGSLFSSDLAGALQIASDKKIYYSIPKPQLSVIRKPNELGALADYEQETVDLGGRTARFGLPPFNQSFFESIFEVDNLCFSQGTSFSIFSEVPVATASWDFGDPASGANNFSTLLNPTHVYTAPGTYIVTMEATFSNGRPPKRFIEIIEIVDVPIINESLVLSQCDIDGTEDGLSIFNLNEISDLLEASFADFENTFYPTEQDALDATNAIANPENYPNLANGQVLYVRVFDNPDCFAIAEVILMVANGTDVGNQTIAICEEAGGSSNQLNLEDIKSILQESYPSSIISLFTSQEDALLENNELTESITIDPDDTLPQVFYRVEQNLSCNAIGGLFFEISERPVLEDDTLILCSNEDSILLQTIEGYDSYLWSTGETTASIEVTEAGIYEVLASNGVGCEATAQFTVTQSEAFTIAVTVSEYQQENTLTITVTGPSEGLRYSIDGGITFQTSNRFTDIPARYYDVVVLDDTGCEEVTTRALVRGAPRYFTPNGDGIHDYWHINEARFYSALSVRIFDRYGKLIKQLNERHKGWDGTYRGNVMPTGNYWFEARFPEFTYTGYFVLVRGTN